MSNRPNRRRRRYRPELALVEEFGKLSALGKGCTCQPDITATHERVTVRHDDSCPAVNAASDVAVFMPPSHKPGA